MCCWRESCCSHVRPFTLDVLRGSIFCSLREVFQEVRDAHSFLLTWQVRQCGESSGAPLDCGHDWVSVQSCALRQLMCVVRSTERACSAR